MEKQKPRGLVRRRPSASIAHKDLTRRIGDLPLVAIGGLSVERAPSAFAAGADIVSVVTDITLNADPEARIRDWIEVTR